MRILVVLNGRYLCRWHGWLTSRLAAVPGVRLAVALEDDAAPALPRALRLLLDAERRIGRGRVAASDQISGGDLGANVILMNSDPHEFDTVLNLSGLPLPTVGGAHGRIIHPTFDGQSSLAAMWSALLNHRSPRLGLAIEGEGHRDFALPAIEHPHQIREAADHVFSRLVQILATAATEGANALPRALSEETAPPLRLPLGSRSVLRFAWDKVAEKASRVLSRRLGKEPKWRVGWRLAPEGRSHLAGLGAIGDYHVLADDGRRYFADPFTWDHEGVHHVFVEELPLATGRGLISHFTISADGRASAPRPVLETGHHLSYPQIFTHDGQIYMMPECSSSGAVDVYRADPFPTRWVPAFRLLDAELHDATLVAHDGRFYLFGSTRNLASSSWDSLSIYSADELSGPFRPLPGNPVLIDRRASRPAGNLYRTGDALWRPAQDCSAGYGSALAIARVTRLDRDGFAQEVAGILRLGGAHGAHGPHTVNWTGGLEVIDFLS